ncbi:myelin basic protein-like [Puntigrus tetrazona]|uniref:myelin basic protein-like n=1 Tax=Puntigrus tetrazona TaxID=1606681 RepID=UPI001C8A7EF8|nr:myelin basic protein-like [Puntigrus tetrazona]XP_043115974.1 myelin basic protein-like [Puntigrus tetrazona]
MGQHLGKREPHTVPKGASTVSEPVPTDSQDEVFGLGEADLNQNNGCSSKSPVVTDSMNAAVDQSSWSHLSSDDPNASGPRPHLIRLFSRDAPGREDNTFKDRPSESDELQTIHEHSGAGSECGSECAE